jgi:hypothetical protein
MNPMLLENAERARLLAESGARASQLFWWIIIGGAVVIAFWSVVRHVLKKREQQRRREYLECYFASRREAARMEKLGL